MAFLPESSIVADDLARSLIAEIAALPGFVFTLSDHPSAGEIKDAVWRMNFALSTVISFLVRTKDTLTNVRKMHDLSKCPGDKVVYQSIVSDLTAAISQARERIDMLKIQKSALTLALDSCKLSLSTKATQPTPKIQ
jgi:hypothetical protein